jgi:hypothetical protein
MPKEIPMTKLKRCAVTVLSVNTGISDFELRVFLGIRILIFGLP